MEMEGGRIALVRELVFILLKSIFHHIQSKQRKLENVFILSKQSLIVMQLLSYTWLPNQVILTL